MQSEPETVLQRSNFSSMVVCVNFIFLVQRYRQIEGRVVEISQLQEIFSEKVLHQVRMLTNS